LIEGKLIDTYKLDVSSDELKEYYKTALVRNYFPVPADATEEQIKENEEAVEKVATNMLENKEQSRQVYEFLFEQKLTNTLKAEIAELLNDVIDKELEKDEPDCDLIDECIDILDNLENDDYSNVIPFINKTYKGRFSKKVWSILVACAILLAASIGTVAVGYTVEKIREAMEEEKTTETTTTTTSTRSRASWRATSADARTTSSSTRPATGVTLFASSQKTGPVQTYM
jgi:hypothetical protein